VATTYFRVSKNSDSQLIIYVKLEILLNIIEYQLQLQSTLQHRHISLINGKVAPHGNNKISKILGTCNKMGISFRSKCVH